MVVVVGLVSQRGGDLVQVQTVQIKHDTRVEPPPDGPHDVITDDGDGSNRPADTANPFLERASSRRIGIGCVMQPIAVLPEERAIRNISLSMGLTRRALSLYQPQRLCVGLSGLRQLVRICL